MTDEFIKDNYQRPIISLRITLTNRCNVNCVYCHHDGMVSSKHEMTADELHTICKIAKVAIIVCNFFQQEVTSNSPPPVTCVGQ